MLLLCLNWSLLVGMAHPPFRHHFPRNLLHYVTHTHTRPSLFVLSQGLVKVRDEFASVTLGMQHDMRHLSEENERLRAALQQVRLRALCNACGGPLLTAHPNTGARR